VTELQLSPSTIQSNSDFNQSTPSLSHLERPWFWERLRAGGEGVTEDETVI